MNKRFHPLLHVIGVFAILAGTPAAVADEPADAAPLAGTIWQSLEAHTRATINQSGATDHKVGKNLYVHFLTEKGGAYTIKINWWNVSAGHNVTEYAVLLPETADTFYYIEADQPEGADFPGIVGHGTFRLTGADTAQLTQSGWLQDGSASGFVTDLKKVQGVPDIPIPPSYPKPE